MKKLTQAQKKANARSQLFRQIHGFSIDNFLRIAIAENAVTSNEINNIYSIINILKYLKTHQFEGAKKVGLHPRRRCACCKNVAYWKATILNIPYFLCNKHKEIFENEPDAPKDITSINPYE